MADGASQVGVTIHARTSFSSTLNTSFCHHGTPC